MGDHVNPLDASNSPLTPTPPHGRMMISTKGVDANERDITMNMTATELAKVISAKTETAIDAKTVRSHIRRAYGEDRFGFMTGARYDLTPAQVTAICASFADRRAHASQGQPRSTDELLALLDDDASDLAAD